MKTKNNYATFTGLLLCLFGLPIISLITRSFPEATKTIWGLSLIWVATIALLILVKYWERRTYSSIGFTPFTVRDGLIAVVLGIVLSISVPLLTLLASQFLPSTREGSIVSTAQAPWLILLFSVLTAGITEEIIFRGYLIERLSEMAGKPVVAVVISVIAFTLPHLLKWNIAHVVGVVLPLGLILSWIYLWKRNIIFNMIIHIMIDLPLVFIAVASN